VEVLMDEKGVPEAMLADSEATGLAVPLVGIGASAGGLGSKTWRRDDA
jgi:hypothetical protein